MNKDLKKNPIIIIVIIIFILALFYFGYTMLYPSNEVTISLPTTLSSSTSSTSSTSSPLSSTSSQISTTSSPLSSSIDNNKLDKALKAFGINISRKETFYSDIIFDSYDKFNKNVNIFFNIYFPSIDINNINAILKENNCDDMQTVINNKNINILSYIFDESFINLIAFMIYSENNKTNIILFGLFIFYQLELSMREFIMKQNPNAQFMKSSNMYYLNDYDEVNDFYIYMIPISYTGEISNKLNKDSRVTEMGYAPSIFKTYDKEEIYKMSLKNMFRPFFYIVISGMINKEFQNITDDDYNNFINILKENMQSLKKQINFIIASRLIIANNNNITVDSKIVGDIADLMSPSNFTKSFYDLMGPMDDDLTRSAKLINIVDQIKRDYNRLNNNNNNIFR